MDEGQWMYCHSPKQVNLFCCPACVIYMEFENTSSAEGVLVDGDIESGDLCKERCTEDADLCLGAEYQSDINKYASLVMMSDFYGIIFCRYLIWMRYNYPYLSVYCKKKDNH